MRQIPDPGFPGDDGATDPAVTAALAVYAAGPRGAEAHHRALAALQHARLLVPVVALPAAVDVTTGEDKLTDMATVLLTAADGARAMLAFTGMDTLRAWDPSGRPVPVTVRTAALAALQDRAEAVVIDVAGPARFVIDGNDVASLAGGETLALVSGAWAWVRPS